MPRGEVASLRAGAGLAAGAGAVALCGLLALALLVGCADEGAASGKGDPAPVRTASASEAHDLMTSDRVVVIDVRTQEEYDASHIPNARLLPVNEIDGDRAAEVAPDKSALALVYCHTGIRSAEAAQKLADLGYADVVDFGGIQSWPFATIDAEEVDRGTVENDELPVGVKVVCGKTRAL